MSIDIEKVMEVELIDENGETFIYWIKKEDLPYEDDVDSAIQLATDFHTTKVGTVIPEDDCSNEDDPDIFSSAYDAFTRSPEEYTLISTK